MIGRTPGHRAAHRGVALISALVVTTVVVALAVSAAALRSNETAMLAALLDATDGTRARVHVEALALAALREDARASGVDAPREAWARTTFRAGNRRASAAGTLRDLQARFNLNALVPDPALVGGGGGSLVGASPFAGRTAPLPDGRGSAPDGGERRSGAAVQRRSVRAAASAAGPPGASTSTGDPGPAALPGGTDQGNREIGCTGGLCRSTERPPDAQPSAGVQGPPAAGESAGATGAIRGTAGAVSTPGFTGGGATGPASVAPSTANAAPRAAGAAAPPPAWQVAADQFVLLLQALDLDPALAPALIDWLDPDTATRYPNGAEDEYYLGQQPPYRAANRPLTDLSELGLVRGFDPAVIDRLAPFVCVLESNVAVNVNTAPAEVLMALGPGVDRGVADRLIASRNVQPFMTAAAFEAHPALLGRPLLGAELAVGSSYFELTGEMQTDSVSRPFRAVLFRGQGGAAAVTRRVQGVSR